MRIHREFNAARRRAGAAWSPGLRWLVVMAAMLIAWAGWMAGRSPRDEVSLAAPAPGQTNGLLVIPVTNSSGRPAEPMVLVPVHARSVPEQPRPRPAATNAPLSSPVDERVLAAQTALARHAISPGSLDGVLGPQTRAALRAFQLLEGLPATGALDDSTLARLQTNAALFTNQVVTADDLGRLRPLGATWLEKSQQDRLEYETILELVAERSLSNPKLVRALNPGVDWSAVTAGTSLKVPAVALPEPAGKAALVRISIGARTLQAFDAETNLLAHFPCSIAARVEKRPVGETLGIIVVAANPNYTFDPEVFPESAEARQLGRKLILQPGPNNPVGTVWIGLDKPGYGIHGTPRPEDVGRTESHGCFRLANWNAEHLFKLVAVGTPVLIDP
ncbi:MAG TPA: L,D-transpeptidase [Verrucomicrobiae bacterium]|nr:L,D-transpeptidase [Verrucomicrobiae bacterium]